MCKEIFFTDVYIFGQILPDFFLSGMNENDHARSSFKLQQQFSQENILKI